MKKKVVGTNQGTKMRVKKRKEKCFKSNKDKERIR